MKYKFTILGFILFLQSSFAQITYGEISKKEAIHYKAPKPYDSINNFHKSSVQKIDLKEVNKIVDSQLRDSLSEILEFNDYKKYIGLDFFLPKYGKNSRFFPEIITKNIQKVKFRYTDKISTIDYYNYTNDYYKICNKDEIYDKYYTVIDVQNRVSITKKIEKEIISLEREKNETSFIKIPEMGFLGPDVIFTLIKKNSKDTIYLQPHTIKASFTLVPYFIKMKNLYDGKRFLAIQVTKDYNDDFNKALDETTQKEFVVKNLSKWTCTITLTEKEEANEPKFIFKNDSGQVIVFNNQHSKKNLEENYKENEFYFITEKEYFEKEKIKKINSEQIKKEKILKENSEKVRLQSFLNKCIKNYGNKYANLIMTNEVEIGMNKEMCILSWGQPYNISTIKTEGKIREILNYSYQKSLFFENNILIKIQY